ncbi:MAG: hypothetical protein K2P65_05635 [Lachnospiraceae bacterium]|nr:hypothetical protein [Lachnospiraceae bacterium]
MEYIDESILMLRHKNISYMAAKEKTELFFDGLIEMVLPDDFVDMPQEQIRESFISHELPAYIKTKCNGELTMSLDILDYQESLEVLVEQCMQYMKILFPGSIIYERGNINGFTGWFDSKVFMGKEIYYKLYFIVAKQGRNVFGSFQCRFVDYDRWKPQMMRVLNQIS